jgi:hypothetical protein
MRLEPPVAEFDGDWRSKVLFPHNNKLVVIHELGEELCFRNSLRLHVPGIKSLRHRLHRAEFLFL